MTRGIIQQALDAALFEARGVRSYYKRRAPDQDALGEYVVFALASNEPGFFADDEQLSRDEDWSVVYYYPADMLDTEAGRERVDDVVGAVEAAMEAAGFSVTWFDTGDFEASGCETVLFECVFTDARGV
jgi:hypothetical protein